MSRFIGTLHGSSHALATAGEGRDWQENENYHEQHEPLHLASAR